MERGPSEWRRISGLYMYECDWMNVCTVCYKIWIINKKNGILLQNLWRSKSVLWCSHCRIHRCVAAPKVLPVELALEFCVQWEKNVCGMLRNVHPRLETERVTCSWNRKNLPEFYKKNILNKATQMKRFWRPQELVELLLKGQCHEILASVFFHESSSPIPLKMTYCLQTAYTLKWTWRKRFLHVNSTTQRYSNKIIYTFLIEDFFNLPPVLTTQVVHLALRLSPRIVEQILTDSWKKKNLKS